jgi:hypothetical protein
MKPTVDTNNMCMPGGPSVVTKKVSSTPFAFPTSTSTGPLGDGGTQTGERAVPIGKLGDIVAASLEFASGSKKDPRRGPNQAPFGKYEPTNEPLESYPPDGVQTEKHGG